MTFFIGIVFALIAWGLISKPEEVKKRLTQAEETQLELEVIPKEE